MDDKQLSANFHLYEFLQSPTAERNGLHDIQFNPTQEIADNIEYLVKNLIQPVRDRLPGVIIISSGYRSPEVNTLVKGQKNSQHLTGQAADCTYKENGVTNNLKLYQEVLDSGIEFDQLIREFGTSENPAWIHMSLKKSGNRKQTLVIK